MMANPNIFSSLIQPVRSVEEWQAMDQDREARTSANALRRLALQQQQMQMDEATQDRNSLQRVYAGFGPDTPIGTQAAALRATGRPSLGKYAGELEKAEADKAKALADAGKAKADTAKATADVRASSMKFVVRAVMADPTPDSAMLALDAFERLTGEDTADARKQVAQLQSPEQIRMWAAASADEYLKQLQEEATVAQRETSDARSAQVQERGQNVTAATARRGQDLTNQRALDEAAAPVWDATNRVWVDRKARTVAPGTGHDGKPLPNPKPSATMPAAAQKELFEADDTVQAGNAVIRTLNDALKLNDKAYSGYAAKGRAVLRSNLPGESDAADATINLDNMMTGQALESLKLVFGGMPTEGERKILLEMQASADKTPGQRKSIIDRAIKAAEIRVKFNAKKAEALRKGTYLTEGMPDEPAEPTGLPAASDIDAEIARRRAARGGK